MIESNTLNLALKGGGAGPIFYLKNLGYTDRQEIKFDPIHITIDGKDAKL